MFVSALNIPLYSRANFLSAFSLYMGHNTQTTVAYDNLTFMDTVRDESITNQSKFMNLTTSVIVKCPEFPTEGLKQIMHNPLIPLDFNAVYQSPGVGLPDDGLREQFCQWHIINAIKLTHSESVKSIYKNTGLKPPDWPALDRLPATKTEFRQFPAIWEDESTTDGNLRIHDYIFLRYLHLSTPTRKDPGQFDDFNERLWLVHGDQLTIVCSKFI